MIKVEHTKTHRYQIESDIEFEGHPKPKAFREVSVTEAKLVLVDTGTRALVDQLSICDDGYLIPKSYGWAMGRTLIKPILISETEKISTNVGKTLGDWSYNSIYKKIFQMVGDVTDYDFKILALPEHFSLSQLQMIVDGKLKDGDKVLVECVKTTIKLNPINIYPVEEKMYTKEEVIVLLNKLLESHNNCLPDSYSQMDSKELMEYLDDFVEENLN